MKVVSYVYNALSKWARRIDTEMVYLTISMTGLAIGFVLFTWGIGREDNIAIFGGAGIIVIAIVMWFLALRKAEIEQREQRARWNHLFAILEAIAEKMGVDLDRLNSDDSEPKEE